MISSMTGFGSAEGKVGNSEVSIEIRTVNHRFFNPSIKLPGGYAKWEGEVRELLRQRVARGHVSLTARVDRDAGRRAGINEERFAEYVVALRDLQSRHGLSEQLDIASILALPDVIDAGADDPVNATPGELLGIVEQALIALQRMRAEEGARLSRFLLERIALVEMALQRIGERAPVRLAEQVTRMRKSVRELAGATSVDPQRLAQEVAVMADRLDIAEELDRFFVHVESFRDSVQKGGSEPVGKRLGFLLQEMVREANTMGSKASDAPILGEVVVIKEELERIREQAENIE
ncbi:MAG TPA: YicC/YloC family endoribonuclease [Gemmatimonadaceae bacterium]|nr:YicC/YloC family endoribonuclease [Gemmatimonadaceae bacterium]